MREIASACRAGLRPTAAGFVLALLSACGATDDFVCLDSYCASQEGGRYIDHLDFDADDYEVDSEVRRENIQSVRAVHKGLFRDEGLESYTRSILDRIVDAGPAINAKPEVVIVANVSLNAQALPGGLIVLHHSLFDYLDNEEQLAFILSHEYAHYLLDHFSFFDRLRPYALTAAETVVALQNTGETEDLRAMLRVYGSDVLARDLLYPAWSRQKEDEADRLGVDLMVRAGYNPIGAQEFLEVLADYEEQVGRKAKIELNNLEKEIIKRYGEEDSETTTNPVAGGLEPVSFLARKGVAAYRDLQEDIAARHEEAKERLATVTTYIERDYDDETFFDRPETRWAQALSRSRSVLKGYAEAADVIEFLESEEPTPNKLRGLEAKARSAVTGATENHSYTRLAFYLLRREQSKLSLAEKNLDIAIESDPQPSFQVLQAKANLLEARGEHREAYRMLETNAEDFDWPLSAFLSLIRLAPMVGEADRRTELVASCAFRYPQSQFVCRSAS